MAIDKIKERESKRRWEVAHREEIRIRTAKYRAENADHVKKLRDAWRLKNRDKLIARNREWRRLQKEKNMTNRFDPVTHTYTMMGRPVPSVTRIINDVMAPDHHGATQWHMDRGTAVHAACAMIAQGKDFTHDAQIDGQVKACRVWFAIHRPTVIMVEHQIYSEKLRYAGTVDMVCMIGGVKVVVDWKSTHTPVCDWLQLAAYGMETDCNNGLIVELHEDGTHKTIGTPDGKFMPLAVWKNRFACCLSVYNLKRMK